MKSNKIELGDFQTPNELTVKVLSKLVQMGIRAPSIVEPTCGEGTFVLTARTFFPNSKIIGLEINEEYVQSLDKKLVELQIKDNIVLLQQDFFTYNLEKSLSELKEPILFLGNPPWVTNSKLGELNSSNLPTKTNFQKHSGIAAITGKSNFDISEWMLLKIIDAMKQHDGYLAMLVKSSVARKILERVWNKNYRSISDFTITKIDAKKYFNISADACLFTCKFSHSDFPSDKTCDIYDSLDGNIINVVGIYKNQLVNDINTYSLLNQHFEDDVFRSTDIWRTGVKHDLSPVLEIEKKDEHYVNGFGELVDVENEFVYPLMKSSDVANARIFRKYIIVTQKNTSDDPASIKFKAPKLWNYLAKYSENFEKRKSSIYKKKSQFSIFGIGDYTFSKWKIAISGLYKSLNFVLVDSYEGKPILFDDTVNFLSFSSESEARKVYEALTMSETLTFLNSLIFWDSKRPITTSILNKLNIEKVVQYYEKRNHPS
ncbi:MAG: SAM-dependent methyltransferase [Patescibacteria group bacterium]